MDIHEAETAVKVIQRQNEFGEQVCQQLQDARAWAALWKRAARGYRANYLWGKKRLAEALAENERQAAEIERLREALEEATAMERARCLNVISSFVLRARVKPHGAVGQALDFIMREMKGDRP